MGRLQTKQTTGDDMFSYTTIPVGTHRSLYGTQKRRERERERGKQPESEG